MKERILFMLLSVTVVPILESIVAILEAKAKQTDSFIDDVMVGTFRAVLEMLKMPEFIAEIKK